MTPDIPEHVPKHLVRDFDIYLAPELQHDPYRNMVEARRNGLPPIFYTPRNGGHWVVTGAVEALEMLRDIERFSNEPEFNAGARKPWTLPNQSDPPEHTDYRRMINPAFAPRAIAAMEQQYRTLSGEILDALLPRGKCEFVKEIGKQFPVKVFLRMANAPEDDREWLVELTDRMNRDSKALRDAAGHDLGKYVMKLIDDRRDAPGDDLLGMLIRGRVQGDRPLNYEEMLGMGVLLFLGGLDTVSSTLAFIMLFLGRNPGHYQQLMDDPARIPAAVEELIRTHSVASMPRGVRNDTEFLGLQFKKYDRVYFMTQLYGLDERQIDDPLRVDFSRPISPHLGFGVGPHRCIGSHLARAEVKIFLEEWIKRFPRFWIDSGEEIATHGGNVWSPLVLPLAWEPRAAAPGRC